MAIAILTSASEASAQLDSTSLHVDMDDPSSLPAPQSAHQFKYRTHAYEIGVGPGGSDLYTAFREDVEPVTLVPYGPHAGEYRCSMENDFDGRKQPSHRFESPRLQMKSGNGTWGNVGSGFDFTFWSHLYESN